MNELARIWYVAAQRLCNFHCAYCVSIGDWAKSSQLNWRSSRDLEDFRKIVHWIGTRPVPVGVRLATLGEPFASQDFLQSAAWLINQPTVDFVELVTNGSLLKSRLPKMAADADLSKLSLWITHHDSEITAERLIKNAIFAQKEYNCFVVINALLFPHNIAEVRDVRQAAENAGLRFNLDFGYLPSAAEGTFARADEVIPIMSRPDWPDLVASLGADQDMLSANLTALNDVHKRPCSAGHDYLFIGIDGDVYPCSRYYGMKHGRLGNVLDEDFVLDLRSEQLAPCHAPFGCSNKEDFLNLSVVDARRRRGVASLGWLAS